MIRSRCGFCPSLFVMALLFTVLSTSAAVPVPWTMVFEKKWSHARWREIPRRSGLLSHTSSVLVQIDHQMWKDMVTTGRVQVKLKACNSKPSTKGFIGHRRSSLSRCPCIRARCWRAAPYLARESAHGRCLQSLHMTEEMSLVETETDRIHMESDPDVTFLSHFNLDSNTNTDLVEFEYDECLVFWFLFGYLLNST